MDIDRLLETTYQQYRDLQEGQNADYIPELARVDPNLFGIALINVDGTIHTAGNVDTEISIQSISKVLTMALVMEEAGVDAIRETVGVDATGFKFNSIIAIEMYKGGEMNPLVNAGAITVTGMVKGTNFQEMGQKMLRFYSDLAGRELSLKMDVYKSEAEHNQRNQALAMLMHAYGRIKSNPQQVTDLYTYQCSVSVHAKDLAIVAGTLANGGKNPVTGKQVIQSQNIPNILAVMATAGLYDDSGQWLYATGLPAKSGVGGGLIAVSPGKFGVAAISPLLDIAGNSVRAQRAIRDISSALGGNPYSVEPR